MGKIEACMEKSYYLNMYRNKFMCSSFICIKMGEENKLENTTKNIDVINEGDNV